MTGVIEIQKWDGPGKTSGARVSRDSAIRLRLLRDVLNNVV